MCHSRLSTVLGHKSASCLRTTLWMGSTCWRRLVFTAYLEPAILPMCVGAALPSLIFQCCARQRVAAKLRADLLHHCWCDHHGCSAFIWVNIALHHLQSWKPGSMSKAGAPLTCTAVTLPGCLTAHSGSAPSTFNHRQTWQIQSASLTGTHMMAHF